MNQEIKTRWTTWLRAHAGEQGHNRLARLNGSRTQYCCLGGLCELAIADGVIDKEIVDNLSGELNIRYGPIGDHSFSALPEAVQRWAGLTENNPRVRLEDGTESSLVSLNDTFRWTFPQIADLIDEQL